MDDEIWAPIPDFPLYCASTHGRVRNARGWMLKSALNEDGYPRLGLVNSKGHKQSMTVHRLVAMTFIPNPDNLPTVHHKDQDRANAHASNLEWASYSHQAKKENKRPSKVNYYGRSKAVWQTLPCGARIRHSSMKKAACASGASYQSFTGAFHRRKADECFVYGSHWRRESVADIDALHGEEWRECGAGLEVSSAGRVRRNGRVVVFEDTQKPYLKVTVGGKRTSIHRLVAKSFVHNDDPERKTIVNHLDGNKRNNAASNLEWATASENVRHANDTGLRKCRRKVVQLDDNGRPKEQFTSLTAASEAVAVSFNAIFSAIRKGTRCKGHRWSYAELV